MKTLRKSNIELLRIFAMFGVVACHYVLLTGIGARYSGQPISGKSIFLSLWGCWGATAINVYVMITGYFMSQSALTLRRYFRIAGPVILYAFLGFIFSVVCLHIPMTFVDLLKKLKVDFLTVNVGFTPSFLWFCLLIPSINRIIETSKRGEIGMLLVVLLLIQSVIPCFVQGAIGWFPVLWYVTLYLIGAIIRRSEVLCAWSMLRRVLLLCAAVLSMSFVCGLLLLFESHGVLHSSAPYSWTWFFMSTSKPGALIVAVSLFLVFERLDIRHSRMINLVASTTYPILLIQGAVPDFWRLICPSLVARLENLSTSAFIAISVVICAFVFASLSAIDIFVKLCSKTIRVLCRLESL